MGKALISGKTTYALTQAVNPYTFYFNQASKYLNEIK